MTSKIVLVLILFCAISASTLAMTPAPKTIDVAAKDTGRLKIVTLTDEMMRDSCYYCSWETTTKNKK